MQRRNLLQAVASTALGGWWLAAGGRAQARPQSRSATPSSTPPAFVETRHGVRLFLRDWGEGRPVVLVHGWSLASEAWQYQMIDLAARGLRCVAYDRRGHGRSSDPGRGYDYDSLADDLAEVIEQLDLRHVVLVGQSMGAGDAVRYLAQRAALLPSRDFARDLPVGLPHRLAGLAEGARRWLPYAHRDRPTPRSRGDQGADRRHPRRPRPLRAARLHRATNRRARAGSRAPRLRGGAARPFRHASRAAQPRPRGNRARSEQVVRSPAAGAD